MVHPYLVGGPYGQYWNSNTQTQSNTAALANIAQQKALAGGFAAGQAIPVPAGTSIHQALSAALYQAYTGTSTVTNPGLTPLGALGVGSPFGPSVAKLTPLETKVTAGEIEAYRVWRLQRGFLYSMAVNYVWSPGSVEHADVNNAALSSPGLHAFKTIGDAVSEYGPGFDVPNVIGKVLLWGEVIEHERGYRAEFAKIESILYMLEAHPVTQRLQLWRRRRTDTRLEDLRKLYACEETEKGGQ